LQERWAFGFSRYDRSGRIAVCAFDPDGNGRFLRLQELVRGSDDANKIRIVLSALGTVMALETSTKDGMKFQATAIQRPTLQWSMPK